MTTAYLPLGGVVVAGGKTAFADAGMIVLPAVVVPPIEPPVSGGGYAGGGGVRRIRKFAPRKRKREDEEEQIPVVGSTPVEAPTLPPLPPPPEVPPALGLMAGIPMPPITVLRSPPVENEDEIEIALLLELLS